ncbi:uncharacterized protein DUF4349 [Melghiribacillus thermohalophilus]|uniref:Uncharacterized protein DUF4349 n=1 Tax=Melghiribacillus thermohalophilus TaxID=1324956 RepID=A0A4R3NB44_9BACI|nr:DUF4349 domain-containing protein [Melghiribacillus thermohalophilus]TCT26859.1 uncharacterized protein DUF4349 [Melghiribacillus thermohalophilus]
MKYIKLYIIATFLWFTASCSSQDHGMKDESGDASAQENHVEEQANLDVADRSNDAEVPAESNDTHALERMVMYNVHLRISVKQIDSAIDEISLLTNKQNGYIVHSSVRNNGRNQRGNMQVRIPNDQLERFIEELKAISEKILENEKQGKDVTEEYVDLTSRLKAKRAVEMRLLEFMAQAEKTEDLLQISRDLERVQGEIESMEGRKNYLENRTDYAEVTIILEDISVQVPGIAEEDLQTRERMKQAFIQSINGIAKFFSVLAVLVVGYSPFIMLFLLIGGGGWMIYRRTNRKANRPE